MTPRVQAKGFFRIFGRMWNTLTMVFNGIGILLLIQFMRFKIKDYQREGDKANYWTFSRHRYILSVGGLLLLSLLIVELLLPGISPLEDEIRRTAFNAYVGIATAFVISLVWAIYLRKLDVFEPEKWHHLFLVFVMGCITVWMVFPISYFNNALLGFDLNGGIVNDFLYCTVGIGMVEEFVKMIPLLIIVRFPKIVNEPYDYLLYASISALGFAFIENSIYIQNTNFMAVNGRALMSTVAHMTFSSVIGYAFMVSACRQRGQGWYFILGGFLLASLMHGFYDFWLINPTAQQWNGLSFLFFVLTTHYWFTLKSKAINASYFYDASVTIVNDRVRYFLLTALVSILSGSTLLIGVFHGSNEANEFLTRQIYAYGFLIYYLSFSFSRFVIAPKALAACQVIIEKTIPEEPDAKPPGGWEAYHRQK